PKLKALQSGLTLFAVIFTITIAAIAICEGVARQVVRSIKWADDPYMLAMTDENLRKLYDTDNPEFYRDVLSEGWGRGVDVDYQPFTEFMTRPYEGTHVHVTTEGFRTPKDGPSSLASAKRKMFVFGGSTAFGMGVADGETIAAYLQSEARRSGQEDIDVYNFGVVSFYSTQERILFERLINLGHVPEIAVFVDGLNDAINCNIPDATEFSPRIRNALSGGAGRTLLETYAIRSNVVKLIKYYAAGQSLAKSRPGAACDGGAARANAIMRRLDSNRRIIAAIGRAFGVKTVFVHQPVAYFGSPQPKVGHEPPDVVANKESIRLLYENMVAARAEGRAFVDNVLWLENETIKESMYVDNVHYSLKFNARIAHVVYEHLAASLK
ncbi:MAG: SGNH/GDSL hydrolase family protein, partial [Proteobacteria bacterium]|nr:SGNH/GDSL hydrolase family protein [Pseudomonadota bacterium]